MSQGKINMNLSGFRRFKSDVSKMSDSMADVINDALLATAQLLLEDSRPYVPVLTGDLQDTGRVEVVKRFLGQTDIVKVVYGSEAVQYAYRQHEESFNHPSLGFTGAAKYLLIPYQTNRRFYLEFFSNEVESKLGRALRRFSIQGKVQ